MMDNSGELAGRTRENHTIFDTADISEMQAEPITWDLFKEIVDAIILDDDNPYLVELPLDDYIGIQLIQDGIRAQLASLSIVHEPSLFSAAISNQAMISHIYICLWGAQQLINQHLKCIKVSVQSMI